MRFDVISKIDIGELIRYGFSGLFNTAFNILLFVIIVDVIGFSPYIGNLFSWIISIIVAFFIQRSLVFRSDGRVKTQMISFAIVAGASYCINIAVLYICLNNLPMEWEYQHLISQITATGTYSISFYLFSKLWVFRSQN